MPNKERIVSVSLTSYQERKPSVAKQTIKPKEQKKAVKKKKVVIKKQKVAPKKVVQKIPKPPKKVKPKKREIDTKKIPIKKEPVVEEKDIKEEIVEKSSKQEKLKNSQNIDTISQKKKLSAQEVYINENIEKIRALIQSNLYYPRSARRRGVVGKVVISLILTKESKIKSLSVLSSQHNILSRAAIKTIKNIEDNFPKPKEEMDLEIPIIYSLE